MLPWRRDLTKPGHTVAQRRYTGCMESRWRGPHCGPPSNRHRYRCPTGSPLGKPGSRWERSL